MQKNLDQLIERLQRALGDQLASVILYGSAASGEFHSAYSDLNVLCVLRRVGPEELLALDPLFRWWCDLGHQPPLLLTETEVRNSTDCFPIEFHDMVERRKVLFGADLIAGLDIDDSFYRAQVEYQLRAALLRLRRKAAAVLHDHKLLANLLAESVATFLILGRHALRLAGEQPDYSKRATIDALGERFRLEPAPLVTLMDLREGKTTPRAIDVPQLFRQYLLAVETLVEAVDRLEK
jgi:hypothetical protein